jgi:hypothetical protein
MLHFKNDIYFKLLKLLAKESLSRARKRIKNGLKLEADKLIYNNIFNDGMSGFERDERQYNG